MIKQIDKQNKYRSTKYYSNFENVSYLMQAKENEFRKNMIVPNTGASTFMKIKSKP